ncbi:E3 ubiquitin-protein ligase Ubr3 [Frankliniella fusca]|uniref:E3 ubiquitin-protein ligase Ubr3 n=1 Tax=Frankliniella fusca TaxID=407009 RepID=A0AAE1H8Q2_9NEOP|nr:E3 ubiquitin-protein ligase Ubr3 [Frankliniella fusca]KAK3918020.1 E3 ubiquitin-protein ligase Ubr3 [Frankliniella fusca]
MPKIIMFEGSMTECINYTRFVSRPYRKREENKPYRQRNPNNLKNLNQSNQWKKPIESGTATDNESISSDDDMSVDEITNSKTATSTDEQSIAKAKGPKSKKTNKQPNVNGPTEEELNKDSHAQLVQKIQANEQQKAKAFKQ